MLGGKGAIKRPFQRKYASPGERGKPILGFLENKKRGSGGDAEIISSIKKKKEKGGGGGVDERFRVGGTQGGGPKEISLHQRRGEKGFPKDGASEKR